MNSYTFIWLTIEIQSRHVIGQNHKIQILSPDQFVLH